MYVSTNIKQMFEVSPFNIAPVKATLRLGHAGIINYSISFISTRFISLKTKEKN